jgi:TonB family protein
LFFVQATAADQDWSFEQASADYKNGRYGQAYKVFRHLAGLGDGRAQLLLGLILLDGRGSVPDPVEAFAWLHIASRDTRWGDDVADRAWAAKIRVVSSLSGTDLIKAERRVAEYDEGSVQRLRTVYEDAAKLFVPSDSRTPPLEGCARGADLPDCPARATLTDPDAACTGEVPVPDIGPSVFGRSTRRNLPTWPAALNYWGSYRTEYIAHVAASGLVCRVAVVVSSGDSVADRYVQRAVGQWRFAPATRDGRPLQSYMRGAVLLRGGEP